MGHLENDHARRLVHALLPHEEVVAAPLVKEAIDGVATVERRIASMSR